MALTDPETVPSLGEPVDAEQAPRRRRRRTALIWVLIVVASLIGLASILTTWVNRQMFDNESWKKASAELIEDQQVRDAVSVFLVNELYDNVDVAAELEARLPDNLDTLAAPLAGALRQSATDHDRPPARRAACAAALGRRQRGRAGEARQRAREHDG